MAIIAGNFDLAEIIKVHKASDVGEWTDCFHLFSSPESFCSYCMISLHCFNLLCHLMTENQIFQQFSEETTEITLNVHAMGAVVGMGE